MNNCAEHRPLPLLVRRALKVYLKLEGPWGTLLSSMQHWQRLLEE
jgi:hypothetical protein